jgi:carnitine 3-dehydrogenase
MMKALGTPNITPELKQKVINGVMREAAGRAVDQLAQEENRVLIGLLKLREETGLNKASAEPMAAA